MSLSNSSLAKSMAIKQINNNYPGLMMECQEIINDIGINDSDPCHFSKMSWKKMTKNTIRNFFRRQLLEKIKTYKKLDYTQLKEEDFEPKTYMRQLNIHDARIKYRTRVNLVPGLKYHYKNDKKFRDSLWSCPLCEKFGDEYSLDNFSHSLTCSFPSDLREKKDLTEDKQLCEYIRNVIRRREEIS